MGIYIHFFVNTDYFGIKEGNQGVGKGMLHQFERKGDDPKST